MFNHFKRAAICLETLLSISSAHAAILSVTPDVKVFEVLLGNVGSIGLTITATLSPGEVFDHIEFDPGNINMISQYLTLHDDILQQVSWIFSAHFRQQWDIGARRRFVPP